MNVLYCSPESVPMVVQRIEKPGNRVERVDSVIPGKKVRIAYRPLYVNDQRHPFYGFRVMIDGQKGNFYHVQVVGTSFNGYVERWCV